MIRNFGSRALRRFFERGDESRIRADHRTTVRDILARLNAASGPEDMDLPGFRLHALRGEYRGFWAVTARANWRHLPLRGRARCRHRLSRLPLGEVNRC
ncbi:MAG: type II toxin-antitoxin system RelE/ParE family toxin [Geminicoccaceae bacterium]